MSAQPVPSPDKKPIRKQNEGPNSELMRALGASSYTAMPNDQHEWQKKEAEHNPPLHRLWSWMVHNTLTWGHTTVDGEAKAYATSKTGDELHLEHAAKDLKMDSANVRRAWREGEMIGLWRRGTPQEGKRKLFLCGKVAPPEEVPEEGQEVCTDLFAPCLQKLPPYVRDQILARPADDVKKIVQWYARHAEVERVSLADIIAAGRQVVAKLADEGWRSWGIEIRRLDSPETDEERQARLSSLLPTIEHLVTTVAAKVAEPVDPEEIARLESQIQRSVQTHSESVQSSDYASYKDGKDGVRTEKRGPTLLPPPTSRRGQQAGSSGKSGATPKQGRSPISDGREAVQVHAGPEALLSTLTPEEHEAAKDLVTRIAAVQANHPKKFAGEVANPLDRGHLTTAAKMLRTVGTKELDEFVLYVEQKAIDRALGHQLTMGLLSEIASEFRDGAPERARRRIQEAELARKREAFNQAAEERRRTEQRIVDQVDQAWEEMPASERAELISAAKQVLKADPNWHRLTAAQKEDRATVRVRMVLRRKMEAQEGGKS